MQLRLQLHSFLVGAECQLLESQLLEAVGHLDEGGDALDPLADAVARRQRRRLLLAHRLQQLGLAGGRAGGHPVHRHLPGRLLDLLAPGAPLLQQRPHLLSLGGERRERLLDAGELAL